MRSRAIFSPTKPCLAVVDIVLKSVVVLSFCFWLLLLLFFLCMQLKAAYIPVVSCMCRPYIFLLISSSYVGTRCLCRAKLQLCRAKLQPASSMTIPPGLAALVRKLIYIPTSLLYGREAKYTMNQRPLADKMTFDFIASPG